MNRNFLYGTLVLLLGIGAGWLIIRDAFTEEPKISKDTGEKSPIAQKAAPIERPPENLGPRKRQELTVDDILALPNERIVQFSSEASYQDALNRLGSSNFKLLGRLDQFRALRLGGSDFSNLKDLLGEDGTGGSNYLVSLPLVPDTNSLSLIHI